MSVLAPSWPTYNLNLLNMRSLDKKEGIDVGNDRWGLLLALPTISAEPLVFYLGPMNWDEVMYNLYPDLRVHILQMH